MGFRILGVALILCGIGFVGRGVVTLRDPPLPPDRSVYLYSTSRQLEDIGGGLIGVILGVMAYRHGRPKS